MKSQAQIPLQISSPGILVSFKIKQVRPTIVYVHTVFGEWSQSHYHDYPGRVKYSLLIPVNATAL